MEKSKVIRPRNYFYEFLVVLEGLVLVILWASVLGSAVKGIFAGALTYLVLAWCLRLIFQKHHMRGIKCFKAKDFPAAATAFQQSLDFFEKHPAIDKYRYITMFSSSAIPYSQMALNNLGLSYLYMDDAEKAITYFKRLHEINSDFPYIRKTIEEVEKYLCEAANT